MNRTVFIIALAIAGSLSADSLIFNDGKAQVDGALIVSDTLRRVEWRIGRNQANAPWWSIERMTLERSRAAGAAANQARIFEESWAKAYGRAGSTNYRGAIADLTAALELAIPANYGDVESYRLRLMLYLAQARLGVGEDPTADVTAYLAKAREVATGNYARAGNVSTIGRKVSTSGGHEGLAPFDGVDLAHVHSGAIDAYLVQARWHKSKGERQEAWDAGYKLAAKLAEDAQQAFDEPIYISRFAVPILREAAEMFTTGAAPSWKDSADIYRRIEGLARAIRDRALEQTARMQGARSNINQNQLPDAERVYRDVLVPYENGRKAAKPGDRNYDWLTPEKAALYAEAKNGYGLIRLAEGKHEEALRFFVESLAFFSSDRSVRAEALFFAASINLTLGERAKLANRSAEAYRRTAEAYVNELRLTFADTAFGKRNGELQARIRALGGS